MLDIIKSPITSINVYDVKSQKHNSLKVNARPFYALTYRKNGIAKIDIDGKTLISHKDCITLTPKNTHYTTEILEETHIIAIHFDCLDNKAFQTPFVIENNNPLILALFDMIYDKYSANDIYNYTCFSLFYRLLDEITSQLHTTHKNTINHKILKAKKEIDTNFTDSDFNINKLAESLSVNTSYLRREFKNTYSISPITYLKNIRLQNAELLLISNYYSVEEIAKKCGYNSTSYFIQSFHKSKGCSPIKYKELYLNS